jgi:dTDP-4-amino-4,6-dideoxygalactose transaminase
MIPFAPPYIDDEMIEAVVDTLRSGWITTGPKTKKFEKELAAYCGISNVLGVNSATAGLELMLRWFGVKENDEVILPAYTYSATANVVMHCGARPVFVDVSGLDFNIDVEKIKKAITRHTKVIMPVDFAGLPANYKAILKLVQQPEIKALFSPENEMQEKLGRILVLSDSAHSFGARRGLKRAGSLADASVFSFHAVKNLTTAEGGAIALNLPKGFDNEKIYQDLCVFSLHGQNKDALAKLQKGNWKYDIVYAGYKCNMTDIAAAMGLVQLKKYDSQILLKRQEICQYYNEKLVRYPWAQLPVFSRDFNGETATSSYHLYPLRIHGISEEQRNEIIRLMAEDDVSVNVHFLPVPSTSFYKNQGFRVEDYPVCLDNYQREITLPVFYQLTSEMQDTVINSLLKAVKKVMKHAAIV